MSQPHATHGSRLGQMSLLIVCSKRLPKYSTFVIPSIECMPGAGMHAGERPAAGACKAGPSTAHAQGQGMPKAVQAGARGYSRS